MATPTRKRRLAADHFLTLAASGLRTPIGTDLVLHDRPDPEAVRLDGKRLAGVVREAGERYRTPLAIPIMDLRVEKADLVHRLRPDVAQTDTFHFESPPSPADLERARETEGTPLLPLHRAHCDAIAEIASRPGLTPFGISIGPFSLTTKLLADPIGAVALAGRGAPAEDEPLVAAAERALALAELAVRRSLRAQAGAGAAALIVCEPAASALFVSPRQMAQGSPVFDRFVVEPLLRLKALLDDEGVDLFLHDCGEPTTAMVEALASRVHPAVLSLGSSRRLWEDAAVVPPAVVLFGNLPTKHFYSDETLPLEAVRAKTRELVARMREAGHPFILGSECDVLHVPEAAATIRRKVEAMLAEEA
ncbi:MAG TPA: uroporphyrinogen decarboxylase family protein [Vicinamibacteria bacterium]|nr:uroporphyrinogen decarboxylase family protein [Vicinamibacteria bacterium]